MKKYINIIEKERNKNYIKYLYSFYPFIFIKYVCYKNFYSDFNINKIYIILY